MHTEKPITNVRIKKKIDHCGVKWVDYEKDKNMIVNREAHNWISLLQYEDE